MDALLTHLRTWDPNGNGLLEHSQLISVLKELDEVFWNDDNVNLLLKTLPSPLSIESLVAFIYSATDDAAESTGAAAEVAETRRMKHNRMKVLSERATIDAALCRKLSAEEKEAIKAVFRKYDKDESGNIDLRELAKMASELGGKLTEDETKLAMQQLDTDESGKCDFDEFCLWWASKPTLGGYDEVTLQVMKSVLAARNAASKIWSSKLAELKSVKIADKMSVLRGSAVISPKMDAFESKTRCRVAVKKVSESRIPLWTTRLVASDAKSALKVTESFNAFFEMMVSDIRDLPGTLVAEQMGNCIEIKVRSKEEHAEKMLKGAKEPLEFFHSALDKLDFTLEWSNDFESVAALPERLILEHLGGVRVSFDCLINPGLLAVFMKDDRHGPVVEAALESFGATGIDFKLGYHPEHLESFDSELREKGIKMETMKFGQDKVRDSLKASGTPESKRKNLKVFAGIIKNLAEHVTNAESMTISGIGTFQVRLDFEKFRPWVILQYCLSPLFEQDFLEGHCPPKVAGFSETRDIGEKERQRLLKIFQQHDKDSSGSIDLAELETMVVKMGGKLTADEVKLAMEQLDKDGSNTCNWPEFQLWWSSKPGLGGYSSATLAFLKMKMAGWDYVLKGKRFLVTNSFGVNQDDDSVVDSSVEFCPDMSASVQKVVASVKFNHEAMSKESSAEPALEFRFLANSLDDAAACVSLMKVELERFSEMLASMLIQVVIKCDDSDAAVVLVKVSVPAEVASAAAENANPVLRVSLATTLESLLTSEASLSMGSTFEELLAKPDEPLPDLFNGLKFNVKTGLSAAGRQMMAAMTCPGFPNILRPIIRGFAGFSIGTTLGYRPEALTRLFRHAPKAPLSLGELQTMIGAVFPEEMKVFLPTLASLCKRLKSVESISIKGFIPKPDSEGCKVDVRASFEAFNIFCVLDYLLKPMIPPSA